MSLTQLKYVSVCYRHYILKDKDFERTGYKLCLSLVFKYARGITLNRKKKKISGWPKLKAHSDDKVNKAQKSADSNFL